VEEAADHPVTITKQGRAVAVLVSIERMEAIAETMEILAEPKAMSAIRKHRSGKVKYHELTALDGGILRVFMPGHGSGFMRFFRIV
jgi:prevent-host-death family protein